MGNFFVTGSSRSKSNQVQIHESDAAQTTFTWTINDFSALLDKGNGWTYSSAFRIRGVKWYLRLNPRDTKRGDKEEYISLRLELAQPRVKSGTVVEAYFKFLIYDQLYGKHHEEHQVSHNFQSTSRASGTSPMMPLKKLKGKSAGFLVNDCCVFRVEFSRVVAAKSDDVSKTLSQTAAETLFVQKNINICSDPQAYIWNIDDFFVLKNRSNSPEFELCGHRWFITIYPSGRDKNGHYVSLFVTMKASDTLHANTANLVEISISMKGKETSKHRKVSGRFQFSKNGASWGWNKYISMERFKDPSNGYLVKKKCCIAAQAAVIGFSNRG